MSTGSIQALLQLASRSLANYSESPRLDVEVLLCHCLNCSRTYLLTWPERVPNQSQRSCFEAVLARRLNGEPIAHIIGQREFWSLTLQVTADTLVPRPETELLVEQALKHIANDKPTRIADLGTGSGAIALAIASERPLAQIIATDQSANALNVARQNASTLQFHNVEFLATNWCTGLEHHAFDVILSNPPYIPAADPHLQQGDVRFEPRSALVSGNDGLDDLRRIIPGALPCLKPGGWLLVEHGYDQGPAVQQLFDDAGFTRIADLADLNGQSRLTEGQHPEKSLTEA